MTSSSILPLLASLLHLEPKVFGVGRACVPMLLMSNMLYYHHATEPGNITQHRAS